MRITAILGYVLFFFLTGLKTDKNVQQKIKENPKQGFLLGNNIVRQKFKGVLKLSGTKIVAKGTEHIPDTSALYVGNHRSYFDILTTHVTINRPVGYIAKSEMLKIPFLNHWMNNIGCLFLDRKDNKQALKTILAGVKLLKNDTVSLYIFPEGTRGHGEEMAPFKKGSFKMAEKSGRPIVPIGIVNSDNIFENNGAFRKIRPATVYLNIGEPIYFDTLSEDQQKHIDVYVQGIVKDLIADLKKEC
ncbi:MAG: lysophospholipid acyltransferase family protein [Lachnospiraceae bacterium]|nr:lysophospholipid acyltransferase family protein [Lachnospiraceae bacterium]